MSVYRRKGRGDEYHYDFLIGGRRFVGRTGKADRREAKRFVAEVAAPAARAELLREAAGEAVRNGTAPLTLRLAIIRWYDEVGQHQAAPATVLTDLERLCDLIGGDRRLAGITAGDIAAAVARRRAAWRWDKPPKDDEPRRRIGPATVNRSVTRRLQAVMTRAERFWGIRPDHPIPWGELMLEEPKPAPKQVDRAVLESVIAEMPEGYRGITAFAQASAHRLSECFLRWPQVDWNAGVIHYIGKGNRPGRTPITPRIAAILSPCIGHDPEWVFTYVCQRRGGKAGRALRIGRRYPVRYEGLKSAFDRAAARLGIAITFHKQRHTRLIEIARATGSLKAAKDAANHASIATTERYYVGAIDDDIRAAALAADARFAAPGPAKIPAKRAKGKASS